MPSQSCKSYQHETRYQHQTQQPPNPSIWQHKFTETNTTFQWKRLPNTAQRYTSASLPWFPVNNEYSTANKTPAQHTSLSSQAAADIIQRLSTAQEVLHTEQSCSQWQGKLKPILCKMHICPIYLMPLQQKHTQAEHACDNRKKTNWGKQLNSYSCAKKNSSFPDHKTGVRYCMCSHFPAHTYSQLQLTKMEMAFVGFQEQDWDFETGFYNKR